jgi:hypothetical protein
MQEHDGRSEVVLHVTGKMFYRDMTQSSVRHLGSFRFVFQHIMDL